MFSKEPKMEEFHVVAYASQGGRVVHPEYVNARPNLSQDTRFTTHDLSDGSVRVTIWWMYDEFGKGQQAAHTTQILKEAQLKVTALHS